MSDPLTNTHHLATQLAAERDGVSFALALAAVALAGVCRGGGAHCVACKITLCPDDSTPAGWLEWLTQEGSE